MDLIEAKFKALAKREAHLEKCIDELYEAIATDEFSSVDLFKKAVAIFNSAELTAQKNRGE